MLDLLNLSRRAVGNYHQGDRNRHQLKVPMKTMSIAAVTLHAKFCNPTIRRSYLYEFGLTEADFDERIQTVFPSAVAAWEKLPTTERTHAAFRDLFDSGLQEWVKS